MVRCAFLEQIDDADFEVLCDPLEVRQRDLTPAGKPTGDRGAVDFQLCGELVLSDVPPGHFGADVCAYRGADWGLAHVARRYAYATNRVKRASWGLARVT